MGTVWPSSPSPKAGTPSSQKRPGSEDGAEDLSHSLSDSQFEPATHSTQDDLLPVIPIPDEANKEATAVIFKQFQDLGVDHRAVISCLEIIKSKPEHDGYRVELYNDNLYHWRIHLFDFPSESAISQDLKLYQAARPERDTVCMEVLFPPQYPQAPPFVRLVYPRFHQYTGHITIGGSVCVEELTLSGWRSEFRLQQFVIMLRDLLVQGGALIDMDNADRDYTESEAREAFTRVAGQHGWRI